MRERTVGGSDVTLLGSDVTAACARLERTQVEAWVGVGRVDAAVAGRVAARQAVVRVLPVVAGVERLLCGSEQLGGRATRPPVVVGQRRQAAGLVGARPVLGGRVVAREAAARHGRLRRLAAAVVVRVDGVVVVARQLACVVRQQVRVGVVLVAIGRRQLASSDTRARQLDATCSTTVRHDTLRYVTRCYFNVHSLSTQYLLRLPRRDG